MSWDLVRRHSSVDLADKTFAVYWTLLYLPSQNSMLDEHFLGFFSWDFYIVDYGNSIKHYKALSRPPKSTKKKLSFVSKKKRQKLRCTKVVCYYKKQASIWTFQYYYVEPYYQSKCRWNNKTISDFFREEGCPNGLEWVET